MDEKENSETNEQVLYKDDTILEKELLGENYPKGDLLDRTEFFTIVGLGKNQWGKETLLVEKDGVEWKLAISKKNKNQLIDIFGTSLKNWHQQPVKISGKLWKGDIDGEEKTGVELVFNKV